MTKGKDGQGAAEITAARSKGGAEPEQGPNKRRVGRRCHRMSQNSVTELARAIFIAPSQDLPA